MGYLSGYINQNIADTHGKCGQDEKGVFWEYGSFRHYFKDRNALRWYARAAITETIGILHKNSLPISTELIGGE